MGDLEIDKHVQYINSLEKKKDFSSMVMEHLRMSGAYWGLTSLDLMGKIEDVDQEAIVSWVLQCQHDCGGFGGNIGHDPHILHTLSAVQILALLDKLDVIDTDKIATYIMRLQQEDGSFAGDEWGEIDTRFSYCAVCCLSILHQLEKIDVGKAIQYVASCKNFDGAFGCTPGAESHAGQIFCCVGGLAITGALSHVDRDLLGWWLCEREVKTGGLNGRPEKLADDKENGGISDRPDDAVDVFHTFFGIAGLSFLEYPGLKPIDPAYALPVHVVDRIFFGRPM